VDKVIGVDRFGFLLPSSARVLEVADQFLLLGVDAQDRQAASLKAVPLACDVLELDLPVRMGRTSQTFDVAPQTDLLLA